MIGKAIIGKSFGGCIRYCLNPKKGAEILDQHGLFGLNPKDIIHQFDVIRSQKPGLKSPVWHTPISFAHSDKVDDQLMIRIAKDYLTEMNLQDNQYLIVKHKDTKHEHMHIVINRIGFAGDVARDWKCRYKTKLAMQKLEKKYQLVIAEQQGNKRKEAIANQIEKGLANKESVDQIFNRIEKLGFKIKYNKTSTGNIRGVSFIDQEKGICFKSSAINRDYTYSKLVQAAQKIQSFKTKKLTL
ncbi:relaxase/mobilization nuclease domain-containing protein [Reichenbachiella sp.]|uniref:relaxase/mobilization nuclease domain-containing protein n=1 Tax=Reichenbachiella sp. TaxID=2184521 RepID=UPI003BB16378